MLIIYILDCNYGGTFHQVVKDEGNGLNFFTDKTLDECKKLCDKSRKCNSFAYCNGKDCNMNEKILTGSEPTITRTDCTTYYKKCDDGNHSKMRWLYINIDENINFKHIIN